MTLITIRQLEEKLDLDRSSIYRLIKHKKLPQPVQQRGQDNSSLWSEAAVNLAIKTHQIRVVESPGRRRIVAFSQK